MVKELMLERMAAALAVVIGAAVEAVNGTGLLMIENVFGGAC